MRKKTEITINEANYGMSWEKIHETIDRIRGELPSEKWAVDSIAIDLGEIKVHAFLVKETI